MAVQKLIEYKKVFREKLNAFDTFLAQFFLEFADVNFPSAVKLGEIKFE